jgi:DUF1009 family protein
MAKLAILAGGLALPELLAQTCASENRPYIVIGLKGFADTNFVQSHPHAWVSIAQVGKLLRILQEHGCNQMVMAGAVRRPKWWQLLPDWEGFKLLWRLKKWPTGDDALLRLVAHEFEKWNVQIVGADELLAKQLMPKGVLTTAAPSDEDCQLIQAALPSLKQHAYHDKGQAMVIDRQGNVYGEQCEGTNALIDSCVVMKGSILIKIKKPQQDRRLDLPTIGVDTVRHAIAAGFTGIAAEAGNVLFLQSSEAVELANQRGIFIVGITTLPTLEFKDYLIDKSLCGKKSTTIRSKLKADIQKGDIVSAVNAQLMLEFARLKIKDITIKKLSDLETSDAILNGYTNVEDLKDSLYKIYNDLVPESDVVIYSYEVIEKINQ